MAFFMFNGFIASRLPSTASDDSVEDRCTNCKLNALGVISALVFIQGISSFAWADSADQSGAVTSSTAAATNAPNRTAARGSDAAELEDIIVTARRVEERLQDVPISMTVFSQKQLNNANVVNAQDLAAITPSLGVNNNYGGDNTVFSLRGFSQDVGTQPTVGVYFADVVAPRGAANEIPIGDGAGPGALFDLQNLQVLKGPQGTLFGRNTTGGAVLLVPQKPTDKQEGYAEISYGNYNMRRIQVVENLPLSDTARFRIGVDRLDRNGYVENSSPVGPSDFDSTNYLTVRASLVVDLSPNLENYQIFQYTHSNDSGTAQKLIACDTTPQSGLGFALGCPALARNQGQGFYTVQNTLTDPYTRLTQWQIINTTTWRATDLFTVKNIASYAQLKEDVNNTLFGVAFSTADLAGLGIPGLPAAPMNFASTQPLTNGDTAAEATLVEELQLQVHSPNGKFDGQGGVYVEESDPLAATGSQSQVFIDCSNSSLLQCPGQASYPLGNVNYAAVETYFHNFGVYGQGTYTLTDQLKVTGGLRYTTDSTSNTGQLLAYHFPTANDPVSSCTIASSVTNDCYVSYAQHGHAPTWLVDLEYKPVDDMLDYVKYTRGYRSGGTSLDAPTGFNTFQPEKVDTYEVGMKTTFQEVVSGTFNVAAFYNNFTNQQLQLNLTPSATAPAGTSPAEATFNAGKSRIYGLEVESVTTLFPGFSITGGYTYLRTELLSIAPIVTAPGSLFVVSAPAHAGDQLTLSPKNKYSVTATYALPLAENVGRVSASLNFTHTDKQISNYVDRLFPTIPSLYDLQYLQARNLVNANLSWEKIAGSAVGVTAFGTNLTNQQYYSWVAGLAQSLGFETAELGQPRMYGVRVRYSW